MNDPLIWRSIAGIGVILCAAFLAAEAYYERRNALQERKSDHERAMTFWAASEWVNIPAIAARISSALMRSAVDASKSILANLTGDIEMMLILTSAALTFEGFARVFPNAYEWLPQMLGFLVMCSGLCLGMHLRAAKRPPRSWKQFKNKTPANRIDEIRRLAKSLPLKDRVITVKERNESLTVYTPFGPLHQPIVLLGGVVWAFSPLVYIYGCLHDSTGLALLQIFIALPMLFYVAAHFSGFLVHLLRGVLPGEQRAHDVGIAIALLGTFSLVAIMSSLWIGELFATASSDERTSRQFIIITAALTALLIVASAWIVNRGMTRASHVGLIIAASEVLLLGSVCAVGSVFAGLAGSPEHVSITEALRKLLFRANVDQYSWPMHATFLPITSWVIVIAVGFIIKIAGLFIGKELEKSSTEPKPFEAIKATMKLIARLCAMVAAASALIGLLVANDR